MKIKTLRHVNGRTTDGRVYAAGEGAVTEIDDNDEGLTTLMRSWASTGDVEITETELVDVEALRAEAEAAGIKVDKRWGVDRLREEIAEAAREATLEAEE